MDRRTVLRRVGALAGASVAAAGSAAGSPEGVRPGVTIDVSDVSGRVPLEEVVAEPAAVTVGDRDPSEIVLLVAPDDETFTGDVRQLGCCCARDSGSDCFECDQETCRVISAQ